MAPNDINLYNIIHNIMKIFICCALLFTIHLCMYLYICTMYYLKYRLVLSRNKKYRLVLNSNKYSLSCRGFKQCDMIYISPIFSISHGATLHDILVKPHISSIIYVVAELFNFLPTVLENNMTSIYLFIN